MLGFCVLYSVFNVHFNSILNTRQSEAIVVLSQPSFRTVSPTPSPHNNFLIPEHGKLSAEKRSILLFVQLLDISKRDNYQVTWRCRYALNLLLLEFTSESFLSNNLIEDKIPNQVMNIIEYIRTHYNESITVESLAEQYNYHPTYLTALVKKIQAILFPPM